MGLPRDVRRLIVLQVLWGLGFGLIAPIQPLFLASIGAGPTQIGLVFGIGNIAGGLLILPAGLAADRWGRRLVIIASGLSGTLGALVLVPLATWEPATVSSVLYWAGTASLPAMSAHVSAIAPRAVLGRAMGLVYGAFFLGFIVASPLAGTLAAHFGMRATILAGAVLFALSTASAFGLDPGRAVRAAATVRFGRPFWLLLVLAPFGAFVAVLPTPLLPVYVRDIVGSPLELVGVYVASLSLGSALFSALGGRLADRYGAAAAVLANAVVLTVGCAMAALLASNGILVAIALVLAGANVASNPVLAATLERIVPPSRAALGYASFQLVYAIGFGSGGIVAGSLYSEDPRLPLLVSAAAALPVATVFAVVIARIVRRTAGAGG
ncbi:MAG TPA: MFS transporter [Candidatus Limnocylindria bacterium]|nr:MFS transporter [Candidatus Limnocylindria bacterium]